MGVKMDNTHSQANVLHEVLYFPFYFLLLLPSITSFFISLFTFLPFYLSFISTE